MTVSMVMNILSLKKHLVSVFDFKAAGSWVARHTLPYGSTFYTLTMLYPSVMHLRVKARRG